MQKINIGNDIRIRRFYSRSRTLLTVGAILLLIYQLIVSPFILKPQKVTVSYGSLKSGTLLTFVYHNGFSRINRADIIIYFSPKNSGDTITRVIGIPGDKIILKGGFVYLNGKFLKEPYTIQPRKTWTDYSGVIIGKNCEEIIVPQRKYFVLSDDREYGFNSLVEGFISEDKITDYLPAKLLKNFIFNPNDLFNNNRDTSKDMELVKEPILDTQDYVRLINIKRQENGAEPLRYDKKLERSADLRLQNMLKLDDLSYEATKSGYVAWKALADVGYNDKAYLYLERTLEANFNSNSLSNFYWEFGDRENFLSKELKYIGVVSKIVDIDSCPKQVIVQHLLGQ
ncbi:MAG: signal peptidase I [Candidatus Levybacteria bacterium]|nr:signal peptidase I [Candidatus Levybacteria bacterium]